MDGDDVAIGPGTEMGDRIADVGEAAAEKVDEECLRAAAGRLDGVMHGDEPPAGIKGKGDRRK